MYQFNLSAIPAPSDAYAEPFHISKMKLFSKRVLSYMFDRVLNTLLTSKESSYLFAIIIVGFSYFLNSFSEILRSFPEISIFYKCDLISLALYERCFVGLQFVFINQFLLEFSTSITIPRSEHLWKLTFLLITLSQALLNFSTVLTQQIQDVRPCFNFQVADVGTFFIADRLVFRSQCFTGVIL